jgi:SAM-dependent methyltransferase
MAGHQIRFDDGAAYERMMGTWSRLAGEVFLDWLQPAAGLRWVDVGCGNGAFTQLICDRCAPAEVHGIDPSEAQIAFARERPAGRLAHFRQGDAMALSFPDDSFDAAVMALVIFFVPEPPRGIAELARVVAPGGLVAAYAWDIEGGGLPYAPFAAELRALGLSGPLPPHPDAANLDVLRALWAGAGLEALELREIAVTRSFGDFDELWGITASGPGLKQILASMAVNDVATLKQRVRERVPADAEGRITLPARANAVKGRVPR